MKKIKINFMNSKNKNENNINDAQITYNFRVFDGALKNGLGIEKLKSCYNGSSIKTHVISDDIVKILDCYFYKYFDNNAQKYYAMFVIYVEKTNQTRAFYYSPVETILTSFYEMSSISFLSEPKVINFYVNQTNYLLFLPKDLQDNTCLWSNSAVSVFHNVPACLDADYYDGRLYVIPQNKPHCLFVTNNTTADEIITTQFNGEYIDFSDGLGDFLSLKEFNGALYAFREYGITKIMSSGCGESFSYKTISFDFSKIYPKTICVCDDKIMMLGFDGIYSFDGVDFQKLNFGFEKLIETNNSSACAEYHNNSYYIALKLKDETKNKEMPCLGLNNNSIIEIDDEKNVSILRGVSAIKLKSVDYPKNNKLIVCFDDENIAKLGQISFDGKVFETIRTKVWESYAVCFKDDMCCLKSVSLKGTGQFELKIFVDEKSYVYNVSLCNVIKKIRTNLRGEKFKISLKSSEQDACVQDALLEVL